MTNHREEGAVELFDTADDAVADARQALNRFDQMLFACAEEYGEDGPELLAMLAELGDRWDVYRRAHEALAEAVNDIYKETLS